MWGSTFSDLARKAQELQEQAQEAAMEAASTFSAPSTAASLFNLDAMRQGEEESMAPSRPMPSPVQVPVLPPTSNPLTDHKLLSASAPRAVRSPANPVGKLKVPSPSPSPASPTPTAEAAAAPPTTTTTLLSPSPPAAAPTTTSPDPALSPPRPASTLSTLVPPLTEPVVAPGSDVASLAEADTGIPEPGEPEAVDVETTNKEDRVAMVDGSDSTEHDQRPTQSDEVSAESPSSIRNGPESDRGVSSGPAVDDDDDDDNNNNSNTDPTALNGTSHHQTKVSPVTIEDNQQDSAVCDPVREPSPVHPPWAEGQQTILLAGSRPEAEGEPSPEECVGHRNGEDDDDDPLNGNLPLDGSENESSPEASTVDAPPVSDAAHDPFLSHGGADGGVVGEDSSSAPVPDHVLEHFSKQMQRLDENFQAEKAEMQRRFEEEIRRARESAEASSREREDALRDEIRDKDDQLHELARRNEGLKLKMDVLKREVTGTQQLLEAKDGDMGKVNAENRRMLEDLERKLAESQREIYVAQQREKDAQSRLESAENDFNTLRQEHVDLKARVKSVATELKDRRIECRELKSVMDQKSDENEKLEREVESLRFQLSEKEKTGGENHEAMEQLRAEVIDLKSALNASRKVIGDSEQQAEKVLSEYKRKAQNSLALANSRAAAAVQAKEEAELEARAARSTADTAMERAVAAELSSKAAIAETKAMLKQLEAERNEALSSMNSAIEKLAVVERKLKETEERLSVEAGLHQQNSEALKLATSELIELKSRLAVLDGDLELSQVRCNSLRDDVATLREQLKEAEAAAQAAESGPSEAPVVRLDRRAEVRSTPDDATIRILQDDLREANKAIEQLKEALASSLAPMRSHEVRDSSYGRETGVDGDSSSTPLFYAMEKQAELNTARDEIMRLANLLSDVQSEKTEAIELKEEMRQRMEEAEARLLRYEKLGHSSNGAPGNGASMNSGSTNIEYLKNIMLRYLNAKTHSEKKSLIPVIGAVLCLTQDEQNAAIHHLDESASLGGVGSSIFDSIGLKLK